MHDIEAQISRISGQSDYMEQLQKITGNINFIDMDMYHAKHAKLVNCDHNIRIILNRISERDDTINDIRDEFITISTNLNLADNTFSTVAHKSRKRARSGKPPKPAREVICSGYRPSELVTTPWFRIIKRMEREVNKFLVDVFPSPNPEMQAATEQAIEAANGEVSSDSPAGAIVASMSSTRRNAKQLADKTFEDLKEVYAKNPELIDIKNILGCRITDEKMFALMKMLRYFCKVVIDILLVPMYDVKAKIDSNWSCIDNVFKTKAFKDAKFTSKEDIENILYQFIVAKYRATVTGNNKHYVKLFLDTVGSENISNMDGARFMEIMDSIDIDKLNKDDKVYKFAVNAKNAMKRIANSETVTPEILKEFDNMFGVNEEEEEKCDEVVKEEAEAKTNMDHADIFDDVKK